MFSEFNNLVSALNTSNIADINYKTLTVIVALNGHKSTHCRCISIVYDFC